MINKVDKWRSEEEKHKKGKNRPENKGIRKRRKCLISWIYFK